MTFLAHPRSFCLFLPELWLSLRDALCTALSKEEDVEIYAFWFDALKETMDVISKDWLDQPTLEMMAVAVQMFFKNYEERCMTRLKKRAEDEDYDASVDTKLTDEEEVDGVIVREVCFFLKVEGEGPPTAAANSIPSLPLQMADLFHTMLGNFGPHVLGFVETHIHNLHSMLVRIPSRPPLTGCKMSHIFFLFSVGPDARAPGPAVCAVCV